MSTDAQTVDGAAVEVVRNCLHSAAEELRAVDEHVSGEVVLLVGARKEQACIQA